MYIVYVVCAPIKLGAILNFTFWCKLKLFGMVISIVIKPLAHVFHFNFGFTVFGRTQRRLFGMCRVQKFANESISKCHDMKLSEALENWCDTCEKCMSFQCSNFSRVYVVKYHAKCMTARSHVLFFKYTLYICSQSSETAAMISNSNAFTFVLYSLNRFTWLCISRCTCGGAFKIAFECISILQIRMNNQNPPQNPTPFSFSSNVSRMHTFDSYNTNNLWHNTCLVLVAQTCLALQ